MAADLPIVDVLRYDSIICKSNSLVDNCLFPKGWYLVEYKAMDIKQLKIPHLALAAMIALAGVSYTASCTFNDSQERQWAQCQERICQALDGGHVEKAEGILQEELKRIQGSKKEFLETRCLSTLGKIYRYSGDVQKAEGPLNSLLELKESISEKRYLGLPHNLVALADCYIDEKKYDQAVDLLVRAAVMEQSMTLDAQLIPTLRKIAKSFEALKKNDKAQVFYQLAIDADARQQAVPEEKRSDILIYDEANLMWDYSSFLARQNQQGQSDALEARADHLFKLLQDRASSFKTTDKYVLGFTADSDAAKVSNLINILVSKGNYADAEALLDRYYDMSVDLAGFAEKDNDVHSQFIAALHKVWCAAKGSIDRTVSSELENNAPPPLSAENAQAKASKEQYSSLEAARVDMSAGRLDDAELKAAMIALRNYNSPDAVKILAVIAANKKHAQEAHELNLRLQTLAKKTA